jgi:hypothetical protein
VQPRGATELGSQTLSLVKSTSEYGKKIAGTTRMKLSFRYNVYLFFLDVFGVLSILGVAGYLLLPADRPWSSTTDSMIANVLSEMIGIYVAVRLIEFFTTRNERRNRIRVRIVRNCRFIESLIANMFMLRNGFDVYRLRREIAWISRLRTRRYKHLSVDEIRDLEKFYRLVEQYCGLIPNFASSFDKKIVYVDELKAAGLLKEIEEARFAVDENILEETDEDDGM